MISKSPIPPLIDSTISIIGSSRVGTILFNLKKVDGKYVIVDSKGLSAVFDTPLYKYCKQIGCIGVSDYDKDISRICIDKQKEFDALVFHVKQNIESNFSIQNNNLSISFGSISGEVTVKNYSRFSIPGYSYEMYFHFFNSNGQRVFTKKEDFNFRDIPYGQSVTEHLYESNASDFSNIRVECKIISIKFIEEVIASNVKGSNCVADSDF